MALNDETKHIHQEKVSDVEKLPQGVHETQHQPATLVKYASGKHQFLSEQDYQRHKNLIEWYSREESLEGN